MNNKHEAVREKPSLASQIFSLLQASFPHVEACELGEKQIIVCDYVPVKIDSENETPEQTNYKNFWNAYLQIFKNIENLIGENLSSKGQTNLIDVRAITDKTTRESVYIMPRSEWEKLGGKPFEFKSAGIYRELYQWVQRHVDDFKDNEMEQLALLVLLGENCNQIVPVTAGLKPLAIELPIAESPQLKQFIDSMPHLKTFERSADETRPRIQPVYNLPAVTKILADHKDLYGSLGFASSTPEEIIGKLIDFYEDRLEGIEEDSKTYYDYHEAFGLLLGFDAKSCHELRNHYHERSNSFMPPDHAGLHPFNANPFNFYNVDYRISDAPNNQDYQALNSAYDNLVQTIEQLLKKGLSPLETLATLHENYAELREPTAESIRKVINS